MDTLDLFDADDRGVLASYRQAFDLWLSDAQLRGSLRTAETQAVFSTMWSALARWAVAQRPPVAAQDLTAQDLEQFLAKRARGDATARELSARYIWRMLRLVDRVLAHDARASGLQPNLAAQQVLHDHPEWRMANASASDPPPQYLTAAQAKDLVNFLSAARPRPGRRGPDHHWQESRDRASVCVQLGAGLTPAEVRALQLKDVVSDGGNRKGLPWKLRVAAHGPTAARETPIAEWAAQVLRYWLEVRQVQQIPGEQVFPSTRSGKALGKVAQYEATRQVMEASGLDKSLVPGGSFRLRHTFALRQLRRGRDPAEVARWLGIEPEEMGRYLRIRPAPITDVA